MKVLFAPLHFYFDENKGSELAWSRELFQRINSVDYVKAQGIVFEDTTDKKNKGLIYKKKSKDAGFYSLFELTQFMLFYVYKGLTIYLQDKVDIVHHVLPFYIGRSINFLFFLPLSSKKVIGPIQFSKHQYSDSGRIHKSLISQWLVRLYDSTFSFLSVLTLKRADAIIAITDQTKKHLVTLGVDRKKIFVIPPGIDTSKYERSRHNNTTIEILNVNYLTERKHVDDILKAMKIITQNSKKYHLTIVGDGPQRNKLESYVKNNKLSKFVTFVGSVPHTKIKKYYQKADVFVNMSDAETFATTALEAMASGLAMVNSRVGGFEDVIENGKNGYIVEIGDYKALADTLLHKISKDSTQKLKSNSFKKGALYDWDTSIIPQYIEVYKKS